MTNVVINVAVVRGALVQIWSICMGRDLEARGWDQGSRGVRQASG